jgi:alkylation response protein AidB-like acyl-CoA dehydrogenase
MVSFLEEANQEIFMDDPLLLVPRSPRQERLLTMARELAERAAERAAAHDREGTLARANFDDIRAAGYHTLTIPAEYGGWGATMLETCLAQEQLARGDGATALTIDMHLHLIGTEREMHTWPEPIFANFCRRSVADGWLVNSIASEPELGSPSRGGLPATVACREPDGWRLRGRKTWASGIEVLTHALITCAVEAPDEPEGAIGIFLVPTSLPGMRVEPTWDSMGMRATGSHDLLLEDVLLPPEAALAIKPPGTRPTVAGAGAAWFALTVASVYLGVAEAARDFALRFAQERKPTALNGRSIATLETVQRQLGAIETSLLASRALLYSLAESWDGAGERRHELLPALAACKVQALNSAVAAADMATRVVGGSSMSRALPIERYLRDVRAGLFHPPSEDAAFAGLGKAMAGL